MGRGWLALALCLLVFPPSVGAQPVVRVRAETRLEVASTYEQGQTSIHGTLRDDTGAPLPEREISVTSRGEVVTFLTLRTDAAGNFSTPIGAAVTSAELRFEGEPFLMTSAATVQVNDLRAHVTLRVEAPGGGHLSLDEPAHALTVLAESDRGGDGLRITLSDELGRLLAAGTTDRDSRWSLRLPSSELGSMGAGRLVVRSAADERRAIAQTEVPVVRSRATELELTGATLTESGVQVHGALRTAERALERRAVSVLVDGVLAATALTDPEGNVDIVVPSEGLPAADFSVSLRFDSDAPWLLTSESAALTLRRPSNGWLFPALTVLSIVIAFAISRWPTIRARRPHAVTAATAGVILQKAARRADVTRIDGLVVRAGTATPLPAVQLRIQGTPVTTTDESGAFSKELSPGHQELTFDAPGYEPLTERLALPHRGEWSGAMVRLRNRRDLANDLMLEAFAPRIPREDWGACTNRELFSKARERGTGSVELLTLVDAVEALVYAQAPPGAEDLARIQELARASRPRSVDVGRTDSL